MSTFSTFVKEQPVTLNHEGEEAWSIGIRLWLLKILCMWMACLEQRSGSLS